MNKTVTFLVLLLLSFREINAQNWQWAREATASAQNNEVLGTCISNTGDVFICGYYETTLNIGTATTLTSNFGGDYLDYIAKYDAAGNAVWLRNISGVVPDACAALDVSADTLGNCYVVYGYGYAFADPGSMFNYASNYGGFHYLKKINSSGADVWTQYPSFGANSACTFESIKTDGAGNSYITGVFTGTVTFGSVTLTSPGVSDMFVVMYDASGFVNYAVQGTANGSSIGHSIDVDSAGNAVVVGEFQSSITLGTTVLNSNGGRDYFIARLNPAGNFTWAKSDGSTLDDYLLGVAIDNPRIYITGIFNDNFTLGSLAVNTHGGQDIVVACTDMSGNELWAVANGGGSSDDIGYDIATDHNGGIYATGNYNGPATFGTNNVTGVMGAYMVKYDIIGTQQWVKKVVGSSMSASGKSVSANRNTEIVMGSVFCCYGSTIDFSGSSISLSANGGPGNYGWGLYISKVGNCTLTATASPDVSINCSDTTLLTAFSAGATTYTWSPFAGLSSSTGDSVLAYPVATTTYTVTATDISGCNATANVTVTVTGGPPVTVTNDTSLCAGSSITLNAGGATMYQWSPPFGLSNTTISNPVATPFSNTTYTVVGTDVYGCTNSASVTVIVNPLPSPPVISQVVNVLTSTPAAGYQWNLNGGSITGATNQNYTVTTNGIYTVTITDANGCQATSAPFLFNSVGINDVGSNYSVIISPNPMMNETTITLNTTGLKGAIHLQLADVTGKIVADELCKDDKINFKRGSLESGIYFYHLINNDRNLITGKLVIR